MEYGKIEYRCAGRTNGKARRRPLRLTLVGVEDKDLLERQGVRALRQKRIVRLTREAVAQGCPLGYGDLSALLLTSIATLKRDISHLEKNDLKVTLRGRRCKGGDLPANDGELAAACIKDFGNMGRWS